MLLDLENLNWLLIYLIHIWFLTLCLIGIDSLLYYDVIESMWTWYWFMDLEVCDVATFILLHYTLLPLQGEMACVC
jgi:hypothetical protein